MKEEQLTYRIRGAAFAVHRELGPGLLESAYQKCLAYELRRQRISVAEEVKLPLRYHDVTLETAYRIDLLVESRVILEIKSVDNLLPIHQAQLLTYLRLANLPVGLLMNFNVRNLQEGIQRLVI
jgi:GxxExxY protein